MLNAIYNNMGSPIMNLSFIKQIVKRNWDKQHLERESTDMEKTFYNKSYSRLISQLYKIILSSEYSYPSYIYRATKMVDY